MKKTALIPARYAASRFPGKLMQDLEGKTVIRRTYEATVATGLFDEVIVVCDHPLILREIEIHGGKAILSTTPHACGTDRIAAAAARLHGNDGDIFVNVQGDEPFTEKEPLRALLQAMSVASGDNPPVASLMHALHDPEAIANPNHVKVVVDQRQNALLFSRSPIPYIRNADTAVTYYKHIGIYAFRRSSLLAFPNMSQTPLEKAEQLEQLRFLENGIPIRMVQTNAAPIGIDTPDDLKKARLLLRHQS